MAKAKDKLWFNFPLDAETRDALERLAVAHDRSKASVLRQLIRHAARDLDRSGDSTAQTSARPLNREGREVMLEGAA